MSDTKVNHFWVKTQQQQFNDKSDECWLALSKLVTDSSFDAQKAGASVAPFATWWRSCFQLLAPFQVKICDIHFKGDEDSPEYIELINDGPAMIDVSGWVIDAGDANQQYVFPQASQLQPWEVVKVYTGGEHDISFGFDKQQIWNNKGEIGRVINADGELVSAWAYGYELHNSVQISHIAFDGEEVRTEADEYVVISNSGDFWADISGWQLASQKNAPFVFPEKSVIPPGSSIRVYTNQVHAQSGGFSFGSPTAIWNNQGDKGTLTDYAGKTVSEYEY